MTMRCLTLTRASSEPSDLLGTVLLHKLYDLDYGLERKGYRTLVTTVTITFLGANIPANIHGDAAHMLHQ